MANAVAATDGCATSYHDVSVEYGGERIKLFDAGYRLLLTCTRSGGWELWGGSILAKEGKTLLAGEFDPDKPLKVFIGATCVCDTNHSCNTEKSNMTAQTFEDWAKTQPLPDTAVLNQLTEPLRQALGRWGRVHGVGTSGASAG